MKDNRIHPSGQTAQLLVNRLFLGPRGRRPDRRIFSVEDIEFIERSATPVVKCSFLKERKTLAMHWFRKTRKRVAQLMDLHLRLASYTYDPNPRFELRLTAKSFTANRADRLAGIAT